MKNAFLTPELSAQARSELGLSQAKVSKEIGLSRGYLSQFESGKRVLADDQVSALQEYYLSAGWKPADEQEEKPVEASVLIIDGLVVAGQIDGSIDDLMQEYYDTKSEIDKLRSADIQRGWFGGLDHEAAEEDGKKLLLLYRRLDEIKDILQGRAQSSQEVGIIEEDDIQTLGEYIDMLAGKIAVQAESGEVA